MGLRLKNSSGNYVELNAPSSIATDFGLTLPVNDGDSGQYLQTNGTGTLSWQTVPNNGFESYAIIADQKTNGTDGGTFTSGAWRTRDLNTELADPDGIVTISSNQFTLQAGSYLIKWRCPVYRVALHRSALYDITNTAFIEYSINAYADGSGNVGNESSGSARVVITAATTYEIQHRCSATSTTLGMGVQNSFGDAETYAVVEIYKEA